MRGANTARRGVCCCVRTRRPYDAGYVPPPRAPRDWTDIAPADLANVEAKHNWDYQYEHRHSPA